MTTLSQFQGCIVGLAVGDALGYPAEFRVRKDLLAAFGPDGITDFVTLEDKRLPQKIFIGAKHPPGTYTDDTQMSIAVAEGLLEAGGDDIDSLMKAIGKHFIAWHYSPENNRAPGQACTQGTLNFEEGIPWRESGVPDSKGCGSAMRVSPIGIFYEDLEQVADVARASSRLTHRHDAAYEGAAAAALMVAMALKGASPEDMYETIQFMCQGRSADFDSCWGKVPRLLDRPSEKVLTEDVLGESWIAEETAASAMYCYWKFPDSYQDAVLAAVNTDGDSDSIAAITGSVLGARHGLEAIEEKWRREIEKSAMLHELAERLFNSRQESL